MMIISISLKISLFYLSFFMICGVTFSTNPSCPEFQAGKINIHIICHSHDDLGWVKTVQEYYDSPYLIRTVKKILSSSVQSLLKDNRRKFVYAESAFFSMWWQDQDYYLKQQVKDLVKRGQLEFVGGGWSQNDEATPYYSDIIDQMTLGFTFIKEAFGENALPNVAWQIDPFGHSREQASIFAQIGMDGLFLGRISNQDLQLRRRNKEMEMVWKGSDALGPNSWIFTSILPNTYYTPDGICVDITCPNSIKDLISRDWKMMLLLVMDYVNKHRNVYKTPNIIMTVGGDFHYSTAENWFDNLDHLIKLVNEKGENLNAFYSTPSCYLNAVNKANITWNLKTDDFFPYTSAMFSTWTGYFTSRPTFKKFVRDASNIYRAARQMGALLGMDRDSSITTLASSLGIVQHHDGISGTAKQYVTDDYVRMISKGLDSSMKIINKAFNVLTSQAPPEKSFTTCPLLNISSCPSSEGEIPFVVNVYNAIARSKDFYIRIPVAEALDYTVKSSEGNVLECQLIPLPDVVLKIPGRNSRAKFELVFYAEGVPSLGVLQYLVDIDHSGQNKCSLSKDINNGFEGSIGNGKYELGLDFESKCLDSIFVRKKNSVNFQKINVFQNWWSYEKVALSNSGAYIFNAIFPSTVIERKATITAVYNGSLVTEIHQVWTSWVSQIIRLYKGKDYVEIEWLIGPLPNEVDIDHEIINRFEWRDMKTNGHFYTDVNGREMQKRKKSSGYYSPNVPESYFPVTSRIILQSENGEDKAAVMNDRAQGGSSLVEGEMELMVHRRLLKDDQKGVEEALNESAFGFGLVARGKHYMIHSSFGSDECDFGCLHRTLGEELVLQPILTFSNSLTFTEKKQVSPLINPLPKNLHLLTLESWIFPRKWLLRFENFFDNNESSQSGGLFFDFKNLFREWEIISIEEVNLSATTSKKDVNRLEWRVVNDQGYKLNEPIKDIETLFYFTPMEIRSFIVEVFRRREFVI